MPSLLDRPTALANPPWSNQALAVDWAALVAFAGPDRLPVRLATRSSHGMRVRELGDGHYGVVLATATPGLVVKITRDADEARFVTWALRDRDWPPGIVRYHAAVSLSAQRRGAPLFALWREEAHDFGTFSLERDPEAQRTRNLLHAFRALAEVAFAMLGPTPLDPEEAQVRALRLSQAGPWLAHLRGQIPVRALRSPETALAALTARCGLSPSLRLAWALAGCEEAAGVLAGRGTGHAVGEALGHYLARGVLLSDVHADNVGTCERVGGELVVTDPGRALFLHAVPPLPRPLAEATASDWRSP